MRLASGRARPVLLPLLAVVAIIVGACSGTAATQAPATQAPATQAPATQAPATQAPATEAPASGGTLIAAWAGPCCNGIDWLTPWDGGGDAHFINKI